MGYRVGNDSVTGARNGLGMKQSQEVSWRWGGCFVSLEGKGPLREKTLNIFLISFLTKAFSVSAV